MNIKITSIALALTFLFSSCCTRKELQKEEPVSGKNEIQSTINVEVKKSYSWINLMPGPNAEPSFHVSGELKILQSSKYGFMKIELYEVDVLQNEKVLYTIRPEVRIADSMTDTISKYIIFSTPRGLKLKPELEKNKPVSLFLKFSEGSKKFSYTIKNITIEEAH